MADTERFDQFRDRVHQIHDSRSSLTAHQRIDAIGDDLDATLNFKVNSGLKLEFEKLCKQNHSNLSRELKNYMRYAVIAGKLM